MTEVCSDSLKKKRGISDLPFSLTYRLLLEG